MDEDQKQKIMDNVNVYFDKKALTNEEREDIVFDMFCEFREFNRGDELLEDEGVIDDEEDEIPEEEEEKVEEPKTEEKPKKKSKMKQLLGK